METSLNEQIGTDKGIGSQAQENKAPEKVSGTRQSKKVVPEQTQIQFAWEKKGETVGTSSSGKMATQTSKVTPAGNVEPVARREQQSMVISAKSNQNEKIQDMASKRRSTLTAAPGNKKLLLPIYLMMEGKVWTTFITTMTIYALFGDDLRVALFNKDLDSAFWAFSFVAMLTFMAEFIVFTSTKPGYLGSFYFYLDILATVTMISDIGFIWEPLLKLMLNEDDNANGGASQEALDAIQASRVGTKSSRIVRIVRLVRLVRVVKLYKVTKGGEEEDDEAAEENPSLVGRKLSDKTMQRVITVVLSMLIFVQFFDINMYTSPVTQGTYGINRLHYKFQTTKQKYLSDLPAFEEFLNTEFKQEVQHYTSGLENGRLLYLQISNATDEQNVMILQFAKDTMWPSSDGNGFVSKEVDMDYTPSTDIKTQAKITETLRTNEYEVAVASVCYTNGVVDMNVEDSSNCNSHAYFDIRANVKLEAALNILQTIFVMIVLTFGSLMFSADAESLVIRPIEKMVASVKQLAENPMGNNNMAEVASDGDDDETVLLQRTITKIGQLLQIGFGEAGSEIIAKNMTNNSGIEPMCDGVKIEAVFGFCDIRNFTDTTECLQEKVMIYVNKVGAIVHEATHMWDGAANKNIGDAFLLVWKVGDAKHARVGNMCDHALLAFLKSIIDLKRENGPGGCLHEYKDHAAIRKRFGENNFEIKLGMGLHIGWAIEGTIGSRYKIDASYLSPNVNMAARLEAATKQFLTPLLLSEDFYDSLSSKARKRCRQIDRVTVKGSVHPMGLFTCDIITYPTTFAVPVYSADGSRCNYDFDGEEMDLLHKGMPEGFLGKFKLAVSNYFSGEWALCKTELDELLKLKPDDGPTTSLLGVLQSYGNQAPENWKGYRELTEK